MVPTIAVMPLWDDARQSLWMLPGYLDGIREAGGLGVMLPLETDPAALGELLSRFDGVLLTGGHDVSPALYGEEPLSGVETCPARDQMDLAMIRLALAAGLPLLGICRGIQLLNVALGGTLWQDLPTQHPSPIGHHMDPPYNRVAHQVRILPNTPLREVTGRDDLGVNSYHHQAVRQLAPALSPMAMAPDGIVEAAWAPNQRFCWGVQWHPEFSHMVDASSRAILHAFVEACA